MELKPDYKISVDITFDSYLNYNLISINYFRSKCKDHENGKKSDHHDLHKVILV